MGLGQYKSLGGYCGPHTASSVFLILILVHTSKACVHECVFYNCGNSCNIVYMKFVGLPTVARIIARARTPGVKVSVSSIGVFWY